ncbi:hypothetical protein ACFY0F_23685 [Streptomyces sp. NPDC001544]|uniref:hypothetical protein n=1 Tax=Streptomyces sp. NPDC001544 TaxID=3364584 RepID=UPI0036ABA0B2
MLDLTASGPVLMHNCALYQHQAAIVQAHHVCPKSWFEHAGKPIVTPLIALCPTCHVNAHAAIDGILAGRDVTAIPRRSVALARQALAIAAQQGLTPTPTL